MLIKAKDDIEPALNELNRLLGLTSISKNQRDLIEDEIYNLKSGVKGENQAAYHIEFELKETENWAIIHDLRIEHKERVAQIDHVLINRFLDVFVIESKNFSTSIKINSEGEFQVKTRYGWKGMSSPVEQNDRHADVLKSLIYDIELPPRRFGIQIKPVFHKWILVSPECNITGRKSEDAILKMDMFGKRMKEFRNSEVSLIEITRMISSDTLRNIALKLALQHKPITFNYAAKFGISNATTTIQYQDDRKYQPPVVQEVPVKTQAALSCAECGVAADEKVAVFCRLNTKRFGGRMLCRQCQETAQAPAKTCDQCSKSVDDKVVAFCRFNSKKFNKRVLCRDCQPSAQAVAR